MYVRANLSSTIETRRAKRRTGARGIPDVYARIKERLRAGEHIDEPIVQSENLKWLATHDVLRRYLTELPQNHSFLPRAGELVLFYPRAHGELRWDDEARRDRFWDAQHACFDHAPRWIAGVVAMVPPRDQSITIDDLDAVPPEESPTGPEEEPTVEFRPQDGRRSLEGEALPDMVRPSKTTPSYKVEWFPNPTSHDKDFSWRSEYVPLNHLRPFRYFGRILGGTDWTAWHPTVSNAITAMATCAVTDKFHVRGAWPTVEFRCRGVWLGSELVVVGDTIDVVGTGSGPSPGTMTVQTLVIHQAYGEDGREGSAELRLTGESSATPGQSLTVLLPDVIGRSHGLEAQRAWFGEAVDAAEQAEIMDQARQISAHEDSRRPNRCPWYLADDRIEQLGLTRFNSKAVGRAEPVRFSARYLERTLSVIRRGSVLERGDASTGLVDAAVEVTDPGSEAD